MPQAPADLCRVARMCTALVALSWGGDRNDAIRGRKLQHERATPSSYAARDPCCKPHSASLFGALELDVSCTSLAQCGSGLDNSCFRTQVLHSVGSWTTILLVGFGEQDSRDRRCWYLAQVACSIREIWLAIGVLISRSPMPRSSPRAGDHSMSSWRERSRFLVWVWRYPAPAALWRHCERCAGIATGGPAYNPKPRCIGCP